MKLSEETKRQICAAPNNSPFIANRGLYNADKYLFWEDFFHRVMSMGFKNFKHIEFDLLIFENEHLPFASDFSVEKPKPAKFNPEKQNEILSPQKFPAEGYDLLLVFIREQIKRELKLVLDYKRSFESNDDPEDKKAIIFHQNMKKNYQKILQIIKNPRPFIRAVRPPKLPPSFG